MTFIEKSKESISYRQTYYLSDLDGRLEVL